MHSFWIEDDPFLLRCENQSVRQEPVDLLALFPLLYLHYETLIWRVPLNAGTAVDSILDFLCYAETLT